MSDLSCFGNTLWHAAPVHLEMSAWIEHTPFAQWIVQFHRPRQLVELGTHNAVSYFSFCQAQKNRSGDARFCAIDLWEGDAHSGLYGEHVFSRVSDINSREFGSFSRLLRSSFDDAVGSFEDGSIDLLHIDGYHTYEAVRNDFETWLPKLSDRGVILFHDTEVRNSDFGVWKLWGEIKDRYPSFGFEHGHGLGVLATGPQMSAPIRTLTHLSASEADVIRDLFAARGFVIKQRYDAAKTIAKLEQELTAMRSSKLWLIGAPIRRLKSLAR